MPWGEAWRRRRWLLRLVPLLPRLPAGWEACVRALAPEGLPDPTAGWRITTTTITPAPAPPVAAAVALDDAVRDHTPLPVRAALEEANRRLDELGTASEETREAAMTGLRQLARALEQAAASPALPDGPAGWAAAPTVLARLSAVDDARAQLPDPYDPRPDRPGDSVGAHAIRALLNLAQREQATGVDRRGVWTALQTRLASPSGRAVLAHRLSELLVREPEWTTRHLVAVLGPPPTVCVDEWDLGWAAHLAGEPVAEARHLELLRPWLAAAAGTLGAEGHGQDGPFADPDGWGDESRAGRLVAHVCSAYLRGDVGLDDPLVAELLSKGEAAMRSWLGAAAETLRVQVQAPPDAAAEPAQRLRDVVDQQLADPTTRLPGWTALLGALADEPVADAVGRPWLLARLHAAARSGIAPVALWQVASLARDEVLNSGPGADLAGRLALELSAVLDTCELELIAGPLTDTARQRPGASWSADLLSRLALRLGPHVVR